MTNNSNAHSNSHIDAVPGAVSNRPVLEALAAGMNALRQNLGKHGAWQRLKALHKQLRNLYKTERANFELWLRYSLQCNTLWRQSVLADLGGEHALGLWERRAAIAAEAARSPNSAYLSKHTSKTQSRPKPSITRSLNGVPTDDQGLFRLAVIKSTAARNQARTSNTRRVRGRSVPLFPELRPIGLTPDELRGHVSHGCVRARESQPHIAPHDLWSHLMATIMNIHAHLLGITADMIDADVLACTDKTKEPTDEPASTGDDAKADYSVTHPD